MIFAAIYYWFPKATGRMLSERLGKWHFWLFLIGFHLTFDPLHFAGLRGMPRRIYTYQPGRGLETLNLVASIGRDLPGSRGADFRDQRAPFATLGRASRRRSLGRLDARMGHHARRRLNTISQPLPEVRSRRPLWDLKHPEDPGLEVRVS